MGEFCIACKSVLHVPDKVSGNRKFSCHMCGYANKVDDVINAQSTSSLKLEKVKGYEQVQYKRQMVNERCPKCSNEEMYFSTAQLRSADEGQTIFYECPKCTHRFSVNS